MDSLVRCPITGDIFHEPVMCDSGITYERQAIAKWVKLKTTNNIFQIPTAKCPITNKLISRNFVVNISVKQMTESYLKDHPEEIDEVYKPDQEYNFTHDFIELKAGKELIDFWLSLTPENSLAVLLNADLEKPNTLKLLSNSALHKVWSESVILYGLSSGDVKKLAFNLLYTCKDSKVLIKWLNKCKDLPRPMTDYYGTSLATLCLYLGKPREVFHTIQDLWYYDIRGMSMNGATSLCAYCSSSNIDVFLLKDLVEDYKLPVCEYSMYYFGTPISLLLNNRVLNLDAVEYILKQGGAKNLPILNPSCFTLTKELKKAKPEMKEIARLVKLGHAKYL